MRVKTDCKFYNEKTGKCIALKKLYCETETKPCNFFKQKEKAENESCT